MRRLALPLAAALAMSCSGQPNEKHAPSTMRTTAAELGGTERVKEIENATKACKKAGEAAFADLSISYSMKLRGLTNALKEWSKDEPESVGLNGLKGQVHNAFISDCFASVFPDYRIGQCELVPSEGYYYLNGNGEYIYSYMPGVPDSDGEDPEWMKKVQVNETTIRLQTHDPKQDVRCAVAVDSPIFEPEVEQGEEPKKSKWAIPARVRPTRSVE